MPWQTTTSTIGYGNAGSRVTVRAMAELVRQAGVDPVVVQTAQDIIRNVPERCDPLTFEALLCDVRSRMRYTRDPLDGEVVKHPRYIIERTLEGQPEPMDCDDASVLLASYLHALGYPTRFVTVAADPARGAEWSHIYVAAQDASGKWVPMDPIVRSFKVGDEVPDAALQAPRENHGESTMSRLMSGFGEGPQAGSAAAMFANTAQAQAASGSGSSWWEDALKNIVTAGSEYATQKIQQKTRKGQKQAIQYLPAPAPAASSFNVAEYFTPFGPGGFNAKGLIGWGVVAGAAFLLLKKRK